MVIAAFLLAACLALLLRGPILTGLARLLVAEALDAGAPFTAQRWLAWAAWFNPGDATTDLLQAACFRHLGQMPEWRNAMESAKRKRVSARTFEREHRLGLIHSGTLPDEEEQEWAALVAAGASRHEIAAVFLHGYLVLDQPEKAKDVLDRWIADDLQDGHAAYLAGVYWRSQDDLALAEQEFERTLTSAPRHQLARAGLAELLEDQFRLAEALEQWIALATASGGADAAVVSIARVWRKLGDVDRARALLEPLASRPERLAGTALEMGHLETECGHYGEAQRWFDRAGIEHTEDRNVLISAAMAFSLDGKRVASDQLLARRGDLDRRNGRSYDLRVRLAVDRDDMEAATELERLNPSPDGLPTASGGFGNTQPATPLLREDAAGKLFAQHCAVCHGQTGDGNGRPAAAALYPRPRDLRGGRFRLVSTRNHVPTLEDVEAVLARGMPGTSMPSFQDLSPDERKLLATEVLRLHHEGVQEQLLRAAQREGEKIDEDKLANVAQLRTTPGEIVQIPTFGAADSQAIARGRDAFFNLGCDKCHGEQGSGPSELTLFDDQGFPTPPRELAAEPLKGGDDGRSVYLRILLGMPGTPHPGCASMAREQLIDLVHYCRSLAREQKQPSTNHQRALRASRYPNTAVSAQPP